MDIPHRIRCDRDIMKAIKDGAKELSDRKMSYIHLYNVREDIDTNIFRKIYSFIYPGNVIQDAIDSSKEFLQAKERNKVTMSY